MSFELAQHTPVVTREHSYLSNVPEEETVRDFNLIKRLHRVSGYVIPEHLREKIVKQIDKTLDIPDLATNAFLTVANLVLRLDEHNLKMVQMAIPKKVSTLNHNIGVKNLTDEQLIDAIRAVQSQLPPIIAAQLR